MKIVNSIYRFLNKDNEIIYIGKAKDLKKRLSNHTHLTDECYQEKVKVEFTIFETEHDMDMAERYYIPKYKPKYNKVMQEHLTALDINKFDDAKWYTYNPHMIIEGIEELKNTLEIYELNNRILTLRQEIDNCKDTLRKEHLQNDLKRNIKQRLVKILGSETFYALGYYEQELFIKYNASSKREVILNICEEIIEKQVQECSYELKKTGYYNYSQMIEDVYVEFKYNPYFHDKDWLLWIDNIPSKPFESTYTDRIIQIVESIIQQIETKLEIHFGALKEDTIIRNEPLMFDTTIKIPKAILIKRVI